VIFHSYVSLPDFYHLLPPFSPIEKPFTEKAIQLRPCLVALPAVARQLWPVCGRVAMMEIHQLVPVFLGVSITMFD